MKPLEENVDNCSSCFFNLPMEIKNDKFMTSLYEKRDAFSIPYKWDSIFG